MNGEFKELLHELDTRLTAREAVDREWRKNHDERAVEGREDIAEIKTLLTGLPCREHKQWYRNIEGKIAWLWGLMILILSSTIGTSIWVVLRFKIGG